MKKSNVIVILFIILVIFSFAMIRHNNDKKNFAEMEAINNLMETNLEEAKQKVKEYTEKHSWDENGYLKYVEICERQDNLQEAYDFLDKNINSVSNKERMNQKKSEIYSKIQEMENKQKEIEKAKENEQRKKEQEEQLAIEKEAEKRYENFEQILKSLCPYGYKIGFGEYIQKNKTDTFMVYGGNIKIENAFGNKVTYPYTVRYTIDGTVEEIVINGESVYKI